MSPRGFWPVGAIGSAVRGGFKASKSELGILLPHAQVTPRAQSTNAESYVLTQRVPFFALRQSLSACVNLISSFAPICLISRRVIFVKLSLMAISHAVYPLKRAKLRGFSTRLEARGQP